MRGTILMHGHMISRESVPIYISEYLTSFADVNDAQNTDNNRMHSSDARQINDAALVNASSYGKLFNIWNAYEFSNRKLQRWEWQSSRIHHKTYIVCAQSRTHSLACSLSQRAATTTNINNVRVLIWFRLRSTECGLRVKCFSRKKCLWECRLIDG